MEYFCGYHKFSFTFGPYTKSMCVCECVWSIFVLYGTVIPSYMANKFKLCKKFMESIRMCLFFESHCWFLPLCLFLSLLASSPPWKYSDNTFTKFTLILNYVSVCFSSLHKSLLCTAVAVEISNCASDLLQGAHSSSSNLKHLLIHLFPFHTYIRRFTWFKAFHFRI